MWNALEDVRIDAMFTPVKQMLSGNNSGPVSRHLQLPRLLGGEVAPCWRAVAGPGCC